MDQRREIVFVNADPREIPLAVEGRKRIHFEEDQPFDGCTRNRSLDKRLVLREIPLHEIE